MSYSQSDIDTLKAAIAQGARLVRFADRTVEYRTLAEMKETLALMQAEVSPPSKPVKTFRVSPRSGY